MSTSVKTAISIEKGLFNEVNLLADKMHVSRSKLFVMAVQDFIKKNENQSLLTQINSAFSEISDSEHKKIQDAMRKKQLKNLEREPW